MDLADLLAHLKSTCSTSWVKEDNALIVLSVTFRHVIGSRKTPPNDSPNSFMITTINPFVGWFSVTKFVW